VPLARKVPQRSTLVLGPFKPVTDAILREYLTAPCKQRHTATRIHERLVAEHGASLSYAAVQRYVKTRRADPGAGRVYGGHRVRAAGECAGRGLS
jgi:hypothetical protein